MDSILDLNQVDNILNGLGYTTKIDSDEYGADISIKHGDDFIHVMNYKDLDGCHSSNDIENIALEAVRKHERPDRDSGEIVTEDLNDSFY